MANLSLYILLLTGKFFHFKTRRPAGSVGGIIHRKFPPYKGLLQKIIHTKNEILLVFPTFAVLKFAFFKKKGE